MQDNSKHSYDPELVDRGWSLLEKQLDEVLPQKPKRRFAWFWLPLLLGFSTLIGAGWYMTTTQKAMKSTPQTPLATVKNEQVVAQTDNSTLNHSTVAQTNELASANLAPDHQNVAVLSSTVAATTTNQAVETPLPAVSTLILTSNKVDANFIANNADKLVATTSSDNAMASQNPKEGTSISDALNQGDLAESMMKNNPRSFVVTPTLSQLDITLLEENTPIVELEEVKLFRKNRPNWRYYAEGQLTMALGKQAGLLGLAAGIERKLGKSWNLGFSLAYERSERRLSTSDIVYNRSLAEDELVSSNYSPAAYNINQAYQAVSYDRFKGELQAHYQLSPHWRIGGGLSLAYYRQALFNTKEASSMSDTGTGAVDPLETANGERFDLFEQPVSVYEFDSSNNLTLGPYSFVPNRWQLAGTLSVQYQISQHWAINMNYRHDLTEWQTINTDLGTPSFAQFGLRYYFK